MKTKLFFLMFLAAIFVVACNSSKKTDAKEAVSTEVQQEEPAEPISAKGKIVNNETGEAVGMVIIIVKGTTTGTMSGPNGEFSIEAPAGAKKLVFSADGFESQEIDIDGENEMEVKLLPKK